MLQQLVSDHINFATLVWSLEQFPGTFITIPQCQFPFLIKFFFPSLSSRASELIHGIRMLHSITCMQHDQVIHARTCACAHGTVYAQLKHGHTHEHTSGAHDTNTCLICTSLSARPPIHNYKLMN